MLKKALIGTALALGLAVPAMAEVKVDVLTWLDLDTAISTNDPAKVFPAYTGGQMRCDRAYLTVSGDIAKDGIGSKIKARFTADFVKATPVKYAYADYDFMGLGYAVLTGGLLKTQFGNIANWEYTIPVKDATEADVKFSPSADFGFGLSGKALPIEGLTKNLLSYSVQVINGEGYEKVFKATDTLIDRWAATAHLGITPYDGASIAGSYRMNNTGLTNIGDGFVKENAFAVMASVNELTIGDISLPVEFLVQYLSQDVVTTNTINNTVLSASLGYGLLDKVITPYVRYDIVNKDTSAGGTNTASKQNDYSMFYGGLTIAPHKNFKVKGLVSKKIGANEELAIKLELESKLSFSIWQ